MLYRRRPCDLKSVYSIFLLHLLLLNKNEINFFYLFMLKQYLMDCLHHHARGLSHAIPYNMWRPKLSVQKVEGARTAQHRKHRNILEQAAQVYRISI